MVVKDRNDQTYKCLTVFSLPSVTWNGSNPGFTVNVSQFTGVQTGKQDVSAGIMFDILLWFTFPS